MSDIRAQMYRGAAAVTVSDTTADPAGPFAALLVSVAGTIKLQPNNSTTAVSFTVVAGQYVLIQTSRVWSTGTTATVIGLLA
jgi:hypothetical protein